MQAFNLLDWNNQRNANLGLGGVSPGSIPMSSQTDPSAMNYQGSQTYAPVSRPGVNVPFIGTTVNKSTYSAPAPTPEPPGGPGYAGNVENQTVGADGGSWRWDMNNKKWIWQPSNGGGGTPWNDQINDEYQPQSNFLNDWEKQAKESTNTELFNSGEKYNRLLQQLPGEKAQYMQGIDMAGQQTDENSRSAYDQAIQTYNSLKQNKNARFGAGSSAGGAIGELAGRALAQSQGQIGQQTVQNKGNIEQERLRLTNYVKQKEDNLLTAKDDADREINNRLKAELLNINSNRAATEANKTRDKMAALNRAIEDSKLIKQTDQKLRQDLAIFAAQQYATVSGQNFTPQGLNTAINAFGLSGLGGQAAYAPQANAFTGLVGSTGGYTRDQYGNLINPATGQRVG